MERKERIIYFEHSVLALLMPLSHHDFCKVCSINVIIACKLFVLACGPGLDVRGLVIELVSKVLQALQSMAARRESCTHGSTQKWGMHTHRSSAILANCTPTSGWAKSLFVPQTQSNTAKQLLVKGTVTKTKYSPSGVSFLPPQLPQEELFICLLPCLQLLPGSVDVLGRGQNRERRDLTSGSVTFQSPHIFHLTHSHTTHHTVSPKQACPPRERKLDDC